MAITLTESAADRVRAYIAKEPEAVGLRLGVRKTGCSGYAYAIDYARDTGADDTVFEERGVRIVVDSKSLSMLDGIEVDFVRDGLNQAFKFNNPNVKDECGCGESFSV
ncbi:MAG TPA: iron-sulfur cluster assembly accessory protein [Gammaproteobacteria bacterium]|nr:iron-sulfur cluster assembly accessory protein [Gammaproteobacteria bacterium]